MSHVAQGLFDIRDRKPVPSGPALRIMRASPIRPRPLVVALMALMVSLAWLAGGSSSMSAAVVPPTIAVRWNGTAIEVHGSGFTPGGLVTVVLASGTADLAGNGKATIITVANEGRISVRFVMGFAGAGPHGSHDPAWWLEPELITTETTVLHGPNGSRDPAWSLEPGMTTKGPRVADTAMVRGGCDPRDLVLAHDEAGDTWAPTAGVPC